MSIVFRTVLLAITMEFFLFEGSKAVVTTKKTDASDKGWLETRMLNVMKNETPGIWLKTNRKGKEMSSNSQNNIQDLFSSVKASKRAYLHEKDQQIVEKDQQLVSALSKIARVRLAGRDRDDSVDPTKFSILNTILEKSADSRGFQGNNGELDSSEKIKSQKYHCRAIRDVFIPEIQEMMPAYHCRSQNKTFILSSVRFLQDRRSHLDVEINEDTVQKLPIASDNFKANSTNVLPATLVLRPGDDAYKIRATQGRTSGEAKGN